jgi:hypothetical protein
MTTDETRTNEVSARPRARRLLRDWRFWVGVVFALYSLIGFIVVPLVAKKQISSQVRNLTRCEAQVAKVRFNPYNFNVKLGGFVLLDRDADTLVTFDELYVNLAPLPLHKREVDLEAVHLLSPLIAARVRKDGSLNFVDLLPDSAAAAAAADSAAQEASTPWVIRVERVAVDGMVLSLNDASAHASIAIDSLELAVRNFRSTKGDTMQFATRFVARDGGAVRLQGYALPFDGVFQTRVDVDSLVLTAASPYLAKFAYLDLQKGKLNVHGDVHAVTPPDSPPEVSFQGDVVVDDLALYDTLKKQDFFGFDRLAVLKTQAKSVPPSARVEEVAIDGIYARIAIAEDRSFNVNDVLAPSRARADSIKTSQNTSTPVPAESAAAKAKAPPPDIAIGRIRIDGGEVDFSDLSLPLPFATRVHSVKGQVTALSPDNAAGSELLIEGTVDEHGFAKATGFINAFDPIAFTDIDVSFRNIELTDLTPYSGKFAGYRIKRGKLSLGLEYDIKQAQLKGDNEILLEKLTLGEKVESPDATSLPVKLAVALLKDSNGNIDLDLEVAGDLNDPKVNTWSLIWQALKKVIIKITTAPFRFLGNLLGIGGDEMEFVEFEPGQKDLTPPQYERLGNLAKALKEKPALKLEVHGAYDKRADADAIRKERFSADLEGRLLAVVGGDSTAVNAIKDDPSSGRMQTVLETMYTEAFGAEKLAALKAASTKAPAATPQKKNAPATPTLDLATYFAAMRDELIAAQPVGEADLVKLAADRSAVIRGHMIERETIPAERVAIVESDVSDEDEDWVRCKLGLDSME